jgi:long-chain acyl-CoA synthetase
MSKDYSTLQKTAALLDSYQSIPEAFFAIASSLPDLAVYQQMQGAQSDGSNPNSTRTYAEVALRVSKLSAALAELGVKSGDRVAIIANSRPEWIEADLAINALGAVSVSVYQSLPEDYIGYILFDSGAEVVIAENQAQVEKLFGLLSEDTLIAATEERSEQKARVRIRHIITIEDVSLPDSEHKEALLNLKDIYSGEPVAQPEGYRSLRRSSLASLVYTSGTTGAPKGVMQTHGNHLANCRQALCADLLKIDTRLMLFLPLAHSFAKLMGLLGALTPAMLCFVAIEDKVRGALNPTTVTRDIRDSNASVIPIVPRLLEKMEEGIKAKAAAGGIPGLVIKTTINTAAKMYKCKQEGKAPGVITTMLFEGTAGIRQKIKKQLFGEKIQYAVSGGAKLNRAVAEFFDSLGIEILEGYGLTETSVATNINRLGKKKIGTVGPVLTSDIECRLGVDGEIFFRGPNVALGYYGRTAATASAWDEQGWFKTGDLGEIDSEGYLSIVGRKKEIIVTSQGKNIAPEMVEAVLKASPYVTQVVLLGDNRSHCGALVTLAEDAVRAWATKAGVRLDAAWHTSKPVYDLVKSDLERVGHSLASFERPRECLIVPEEFTVDNGLLTPTFKVKRNLVLKKYEAEIEALYA